MSPTLILRDPEPVAKGRIRGQADTEWHALLAKAVKRPGRWWEVSPPYANPSAASSAAYEINNRRSINLPGRWEATSRTRYEDGTAFGVLFVKYLGDQ